MTNQEQNQAITNAASSNAQDQAFTGPMRQANTVSNDIALALASTQQQELNSEAHSENQNVYDSSLHGGNEMQTNGSQGIQQPLSSPTVSELNDARARQTLRRRASRADKIVALEEDQEDHKPKYFPKSDVKAPSEFKGEATDLSRFLGQAKVQIRLRMEKDPSMTEFAKTAFISQQLTGDAARWFQNHTHDNETSDMFKDYHLFERELKQTFEERNSGTKNFVRLKNLHPDATNMSKYCTMFEQLIRDGHQGLNDEFKIEFFKSGMNPIIWSHVEALKGGKNDYGYLEIKEMAFRAENLYLQNKAPESKPPSRSYKNAEGRMISTFSKDQDSKSVVTGEAKEREACRHCGLTTHWSSKCSQRPERAAKGTTFQNKQE